MVFHRSFFDAENKEQEVINSEKRATELVIWSVENNRIPNIYNFNEAKIKVDICDEDGCTENAPALFLIIPFEDGSMWCGTTIKSALTKSSEMEAEKRRRESCAN